MDTKDKHHDDFRPRTEVIPSMTRRRIGHDYESRRMYLITMTVEGRRPILGEVVGNPNASEDSPDAPRTELNALGASQFSYDNQPCQCLALNNLAREICG